MESWALGSHQACRSSSHTPDWMGCGGWGHKDTAPRLLLCDQEDLTPSHSREQSWPAHRCSPSLPTLIPSGFDPSDHVQAPHLASKAFCTRHHLNMHSRLLSLCPHKAPLSQPCCLLMVPSHTWDDPAHQVPSAWHTSLPSPPCCTP